MLRLKRWPRGGTPAKLQRRRNTAWIPAVGDPCEGRYRAGEDGKFQRKNWYPAKIVDVFDYEDPLPCNVSCHRYTVVTVGGPQETGCDVLMEHDGFMPKVRASRPAHVKSHVKSHGPVGGEMMSTTPLHT